MYYRSAVAPELKNPMTTSGFNIHSIELILLVLLGAIAIIAGVARRLSISYPIVLVITGLALGLMPRIPSLRLSPDIVFLIFLPPLLFAAAWQTSWREFRYNLVSIGMLAIGLVFFTALGVAYLAHFFLPSFDWRSGFLLGAVVSTTDAVAATSIAKRIGMPKRIVDILEGESLVNDATGLLALEFGVAMMVKGTTPSIAAGALHLLWLLGGGILMGLLIGMLVSWFETFIDDGPVEIALSLIVAYGVYLAGEAVGASGVIAVVTCGLYMSRKSATYFSPAVRLQVMAVWEALEFLLNGLVFILIGLQLPYVLKGINGYSHTQLLVYGASFSAVLIALRLLWMYPGALIAYKIRHHILRQQYEMPTGRMTFVLGWTGMRGVVALAAASSLPYTLNGGVAFRQRSLIVFLTFSVILVTLVLQGLTLPALVKRLGLSQSDGPKCEEGEARRILIQRAIDHLEDRRGHESEDLQHAYEDVLHQYGDKLASLTSCDFDGPTENKNTRSARHVLLEGVQSEREELIRLRNLGRIGDGIYRTLEHELDLSESRLMTSGRIS